MNDSSRRIRPPVIVLAPVSIGATSSQASGLEQLLDAMAQVERPIAIANLKVGKVLFDALAFVAASDQKVAVTMIVVDGHYVDENRYASDLDHGLRAKRCSSAKRVLGLPPE